jgi:hypothetical protein
VDELDLVLVGALASDIMLVLHMNNKIRQQIILNHPFFIIVGFHT